jgi:archaeosine-15-forming tRNA-guanine transglycosylase
MQVFFEMFYECAFRKKFKNLKSTIHYCVICSSEWTEFIVKGNNNNDLFIVDKESGTTTINELNVTNSISMQGSKLVKQDEFQVYKY